jgi:hypothetical protein
MNRKRRLTLILTVAAAMAVLVPATIAFAAGAQAPAKQPQAQASVVAVKHYTPPRTKVVRRRFHLWSKPTPGQVREIIRNEARRWGISAAALSYRVGCESRYLWFASNGQYQGVLQMGANAFYRGLSTIRSRKVTIVRQKTRRVHSARITTYSDGHTVRRRTTPRRQKVTVILTGRIPRRPSMINAFAQIRIGAQAIRGISAVRSSEWSCAA